MVILSIAILGFVALQVRATAATDEALNRSDALVILNGLAEKIRINTTGIIKQQFPLPYLHVLQRKIVIVTTRLWLICMPKSSLQILRV